MSFEVIVCAPGKTVAVFENSTPAFYNILAGEEVIGQYDEQNRRYYVKDHPPADKQVLGAVRMTINDSQGGIRYQDYYPFLSSEASQKKKWEYLLMKAQEGGKINLFDSRRMPGHERDDEFDLILDYICPPTGVMQARMYDPEIG